MKAELISCTGRPLNVLYSSARTCYSAETPSNLFGESFDHSTEVMVKLVQKVLDSGHLSVAEHINFTFAISGISRACSHQLVRHRHASYSQKSQRYVKEGDFKYITPDTIAQKGHAENVYDVLMREIDKVYTALLKLGVPPEDARMVLPNACETSMTMTLNLREMIHLCNLRLCTHAQWEIRNLVFKMKQEVLRDNHNNVSCEGLEKIKPILQGLLVPNCKHCTDFRPCVNRK